MPKGAGRYSQRKLSTLSKALAAAPQLASEQVHSASVRIMRFRLEPFGQRWRAKWDIISSRRLPSRPAKVQPRLLGGRSSRLAFAPDEKRAPRRPFRVSWLNANAFPSAFLLSFRTTKRGDVPHRHNPEVLAKLPDADLHPTGKTGIEPYVGCFNFQSLANSNRL